jgi:isopenicillin-N N-acyltransferase like protein
LRIVVKEKMKAQQRTVSVSKNGRELSTPSWKVLKSKNENYLYPWSSPIPVVAVRGSPYELGKEHGTKCRERVAKNSSDTWQGLLRILECERSDIVEDLKIYSDKIRECHASFEKEMEGVADGAKVSYDDIVLLNSMINILIERGGRKGLESLLCSSFSSWDAGTEKGNLIMGHNDDGIRFTDQFLVLLDAKPSEGFRFAVPIIPGYLGYHTIANESGFCAVGNGLENGPQPSQLRKGVPMWTIFRYLGQFVDNVDDGVDFLKKVDNGVSGSFLLGDRKGNSAMIHLAPNSIEVVRPKSSDKYLAMTNHALVDRIKKDLVLRKNPSSTHYRYQSLNRAIKHSLGNIDACAAMGIMSTHYDASAGKDNHPSGNTPCRHYEYESKFAGTCRSAVIEMGKEQMKMYVALGNPCTASWVELDMKYNGKAN